MKLYNHDKKLKLNKVINIKYVKIISGIIFFGIGVFFIITSNYVNGLAFIIVGLMIFISALAFKYKKNETITINTAYQEIVNDINSEKVKFILIDLGLDEEKIDYKNEVFCVCFGYAYDENCYFNACISNEYYEFAILLTEELYEVDNEKFNNTFSDNSKGIIGVYETHDMDPSLTKEDIYLSFINYIKNNQEDIKLISKEAQTLLINNHHQK